MKSIQTFLMFSGDQCGKAEEAMKLYTSLFENSEIGDVQYHPGNEFDKEGTVMRGNFTIGGADFAVMDSGYDHKFNFTPSTSILIECSDEDELRHTYGVLSEGGIERMPIDNYGFSQLFGWTDDRYGVSWQLNLT